MDDAPIRIEEIARALHMSERTLRRRLTAEGHTFARVVDEYRRELAPSMVERCDRTIGEVAVRIGFASVGAFRRAFHPWTGLSPSAYRARLRAQGPGK